MVTVMNTDEILNLALEMAELEDVPGDTAIHVPGENLKRALFGIDMDTAELLLAKQLGYDLVIAHHPPGGRSRIHFEEVVPRQIHQMIEEGVPPHIAEKAIQPRLELVKVGSHVSNYDRVVSAARLLNMPFMNIHLPLDIICRRRFSDAITRVDKELECPKVTDAIDAMMELPEMQMGLTEPEVYVGSSDNLLGRWVVAMAGGTNGGADVAKAYFDYGVSTVIYMHLSSSDKQKLKEYSGAGNLVATGHMASDSVGIAPFVKALRKRGLEVTPMSGVFVPE